MPTRKKSPPRLPRALTLVEATLTDGKGLNPVVIDLHEKSSIADYMVVVTGTSQRHILALAQKIIEVLKAKLKIRASLEGRESPDWVLVDAGDVIVHLFLAEARERYNLEKMWQTDFETLAAPKRSSRPKIRR